MRRNRSTLGLIFGVAPTILLVACAGGTATPTASPAAAQSALASPSPAKVAVYGSNTCTIVESSYSSTLDTEKFRCIERMSDPRVSGEWEALITTSVQGALGSWTGDIVLTNAGGTWRGMATGALAGIPSPINYGEVVYTGEGGYAGLTYHVFLAGPNGSQLEAGWIGPAE
jgi:hypothetical protein